MKSSNGTVPAGLTLYQFSGKDGAGRNHGSNRSVVGTNRSSFGRHETRLNESMTIESNIKELRARDFTVSRRRGKWRVENKPSFYSEGCSRRKVVSNAHEMAQYRA